MLSLIQSEIHSCCSWSDLIFVAVPQAPHNRDLWCSSGFMQGCVIDVGFSWVSLLLPVLHQCGLSEYKLMQIPSLAHKLFRSVMIQISFCRILKWYLTFHIRLWRTYQMFILFYDILFCGYNVIIILMLM